MIKMRSLFVVFCCLALIGVTQVVHAEAAVRANNPIDLTVDENHDGLPDELVAAVQQVLTLDHGVSASGADATQQQTAIDAALVDLSARLPYTPETRTLQEHVRTLQAQLNQSQDQAQSEALLAELQNAQAEMMKDPNYALTMNTLATLFAPTSAIYQHEDASMSNRLYLPLISQDASGTQANTVADSLKVTAATINAGPNFNSLKRGHIMLINGGGSFTNFVYVMNYSHSGTYDGGGYVYESNSDGVKLKPLTKWQEKSRYVALGSDNMLNSYDQTWVLNQGETKYKTNGSTPYNYIFPDKWTDSKLYCSQLVWKMNMLKNIDLDSNALSYQTYIWLKWGLLGNTFAIPAVAPDEVALSRYLTIYSQGTN